MIHDSNYMRLQGTPERKWSDGGLQERKGAKYHRRAKRVKRLSAPGIFLGRFHPIHPSRPLYFLQSYKYLFFLMKDCLIRSTLYHANI